jgi:peptide/nickel transport system substrate-binding protein
MLIFMTTSYHGHFRSHFLDDAHALRSATIRQVETPMRPVAGSSLNLGAVLGAVLGTAAVCARGPAAFGQTASTREGAALTVSMGPRGGEWKRIFNPFRDDSETRFPSTAGIYEPLIIYNRATGAYIPWLATGYEWAASSTRLRFSIRSGVLWSDGTPFSVRDVVFTFDLMRRAPALDRQKLWSFLADVAAVDTATVEFTLKRPYTPGLVYVGQQPIVSEHRWKAVPQPASFDDPDPVGTGPFTQVRRFEPTVYDLGRNPRYWQTGKPAAALLRVPLYHANEEIVRALEADELDWASLFVPDIEKNWVAKDPARHQYWYPDFGPTALLYVNTRHKPFNDPQVRKALSMAIDRPRIMKDAMSGYAQPADPTGLAESQKRWKDPGVAQAADWTKRDVDQANRIMDAAGLARGSDGIRVAPGSGPLRYEINVVQGWTDWAAAAGIIAENLREIGVAGSVKALDYNRWLEALKQGRFEMSLGFGSRGPTPYQFYRGQMDGALVRPIGEDAVENFHRFASDEAGELLRRFEATSDPAEQADLARKLQRVYVASAPSLPLYASRLWGVFSSKRFSGFPSRFLPYAGAAPDGQADSLPVLIEVRPR